MDVNELALWLEFAPFWIRMVDIQAISNLDDMETLQCIAHHIDDASKMWDENRYNEAVSIIKANLMSGASWNSELLEWEFQLDYYDCCDECMTVYPKSDPHCKCDND